MTDREKSASRRKQGNRRRRIERPRRARQSRARPEAPAGRQQGSSTTPGRPTRTGLRKQGTRPAGRPAAKARRKQRPGPGPKRATPGGGSKRGQQAGKAPSAGVGKRLVRGRAWQKVEGRARAGRVVAGQVVELRVTTVDGRVRDERRVQRQGLVAGPVGGSVPAAARLEDREAAARQVARGVQPEKVAGLLSVVGHHQRIRILLKLLGGEATHQLLSKATGLQAGPLYYHLRELRAAGLIGPKVRDLYVVTPRGRRAILSAIAIERICR